MTISEFKSKKLRMNILAVVGLQKGAMHEQIKSYQEAESQIVWKHYEQGMVRKIDVRAAAHPGVVNTMECEDAAAVNQYLQRFSVFKVSLLSAEIIQSSNLSNCGKFCSKTILEPIRIKEI